MKFSDAIVNEVRSIRDAIAKEYDYDVDKLARAMREHEATSGRTAIRLPPRLPVQTSAAQKAS
ncbi:hypothetical protein ACFL5O_11285 [Myxococcota bacterium]